MPYKYRTHFSTYILLCCYDKQSDVCYRCLCTRKRIKKFLMVRFNVENIDSNILRNYKRRIEVPVL